MLLPVHQVAKNSFIAFLDFFAVTQSSRSHGKHKKSSGRFRIRKIMSMAL